MRSRQPARKEDSVDRRGWRRWPCIVALILAARALAPGANSFTILHSFADGGSGVFGKDPGSGGLVQASDGNIYGTTSGGGANNNCRGGCGTIFRTTQAGAFLTLHSFNGTDGSGPGALVQATDGSFYGVTGDGGANNLCLGGCGTVFRATSSGVLTTLHNFDGTDGVQPSGL